MLALIRSISCQTRFLSLRAAVTGFFKLAAQVFEGFRPDYIVGIWRGGAPIGIAVQEYMTLKVFRLTILLCAHHLTMALKQSKDKAYCLPHY